MASPQAIWKARVREAWSGVRVEHVEADGAEPSLGAVLDVRVTAVLGNLSADDVCVEVVYGRLGDDDEARAVLGAGITVATRKNEEHAAHEMAGFLESLG